MSGADVAVRIGKGMLRWRALHRWLAWALGFIFILQGLSGSVLVVAESLDGWLNPELTATAGGDAALLHAADILERVRPQGVGMGVSRVDDAGKFLTAFWPTPDPHVPSERLYWLGRLHPVDGEMISAHPYGEWPRSRYDIWVFVHAVHTNLTMGAIGKFFQIGVAFLLLSLLLSGAVNFANRRHVLRGKPAHLIRDPVSGRMHRTLGMTAGGILALLLVSGIALQFETVLDRSFGMRSEDQGEKRMHLRAAWEAAHRHYPESETRLVMAPFFSGGTFRVDLIPSTGSQTGMVQELFIDAYSGRLLKVRNEGSRTGVDWMVSLLESIHGGAILGGSGELLAFLAGLVPAGMMVAGYMNRRAWRSGKSRKNSP